MRMVCNRDELRTRPAALPPEIRKFGDRRALLPIDPASGGTWIAASDAGLALSLLNSYPAARGIAGSGEEEGGLLSRGAIISSLLHLPDLEAVVKAAGHLRPGRYPPFRLVVADRWGAVELRSEAGELLTPRRWALAAPLLFTSSGLGDWRVQTPRRELFERTLRGTGEADAAALQDAFHRHRWPEHPELSVWMSRPEARTMSQTTIEIGVERVSLTYQPVDPDQQEQPAGITLRLPVSWGPALATRGIG